MSVHLVLFAVLSSEQFAVVVMGREVDWCSCGRHRCVYGRHGNGDSGILKVWRGAVRLRGWGGGGGDGYQNDLVEFQLMLVADVLHLLRTCCLWIRTLSTGIIV